MKNQKDIEKIIRENDYFYSEEDDDDNNVGPCGPCWEIKIDKEKDKVFFLVDGKETLSYQFSKIKFSLNKEKLNELLSLLKIGNIKVLKKELEK